MPTQRKLAAIAFAVVAVLLVVGVFWVLRSSHHQPEQLDARGEVSQDGKRSLRDPEEGPVDGSQLEERPRPESPDVHLVRKTIRLRESCMGGDARACGELGDIYLNGEKDRDAVELYQRACLELGEVGCARLGLMHEKGQGVEQDDEHAVELYWLGCEHGSPYAEEQLKRIGLMRTQSSCTRAEEEEWVTQTFEEGSGEEPEQALIDCLNQFPGSFRQTTEFVEVDRSGNSRSLRSVIVSKKVRDEVRASRICWNKPLDIRGTQLLLRGPDRHIYTPELRKWRPVSRASTYMGLPAPELIEQWLGHPPPGPMELMGNTVFAGRPVQIVSVRAPGSSQTSYNRIVTFVDRERCVVLRSEYYEPSQNLRAVATAKPDAVMGVGVFWIATGLHIEDLRDGVSVHVKVMGIDVDLEIPDRVFTRVHAGCE